MKYKFITLLVLLSSMCFSGLTLENFANDVGNCIDVAVINNTTGNVLESWFMCSESEVTSGTQMGTINSAFWNGTNWTVTQIGSACRVSCFSNNLNDNNNALLVWIEYDETNHNYQVKAAIGDGVLWNITNLSGMIYSAETIYSAINIAGKAMVVWPEFNNGYFYLKGAYWNGNNWTILPLDPNPSASITNVNITINDDVSSTGIITWKSRDIYQAYNLKAANWTE